MSRTIRYKLSGRELELALQLSNDLGMPLNIAAKRALLWAIRKAYDPNYKEELDEAGTADDSGTDEAVSGSEDVPGGPLENQA